MEPNKRIIKGTEHTQDNSTKKIGGDFKIKENPEFLIRRSDIFNELLAKQNDFFKTLPREKINITLKDGKIFEGTSFETTPLMVAEKKLPQKVHKEVLIAKVKYTRKVKDLSEGIIDTDCLDEEDHKNDFELYDLVRPLEGDCVLEFLTKEDTEGKATLYHSSAHILGSALENLFGTNLCIGPALKEGFYYDCYMGNDVIKYL